LKVSRWRFGDCFLSKKRQRIIKDKISIIAASTISKAVCSAGCCSQIAHCLTAPFGQVQPKFWQAWLAGQQLNFLDLAKSDSGYLRAVRTLFALFHCWGEFLSRETHLKQTLFNFIVAKAEL
jgi:hypothetical protein